MKGTCAQCVYYEADNDCDEGYDIAECHANPPTVICTPNGNVTAYAAHVYPGKRACRFFEPDLEILRKEVTSS